MAKAVTISQTNNINSTGLDTPTTTKSIIFVDPLGGNPVDNKQMFIYVDLTAARKKRTVIQITDNSKNVASVNTARSEINLIGYREGSDGSRTMTTDWTKKLNLGQNNINGSYTDLNSNVFEGFGVESIDINITAMNPPSVKIKFIDVRGGGLFDQESFNPQTNSINSFTNNSSPYSIFFELPPPLFYLTVKGYYGNPVTFCLYMISWKGTFNSETGNFEMDADFLGYTFAFLQDVKIGHLIGVGNTFEGKQKLIEVSGVPTSEGLLFPVITIDELARRFQRITIKREEFQRNSEEFKKIKVINEQINFIKNLRTIVGYGANLLSVSTIYGSILKPESLKRNEQQIFFRDVGLFPITANGDGDGIIETKFKEIFKSVDDILKKYEQLQKDYPEEFVSDGLITNKELGFPQTLQGQNNTKPTLSEAITEVNRIIQEDNEPNKGVPIITNQDFSGATKNKWVIGSGFYILNFKNSRDVIKNKLDKLTNARAEQEKLIKKIFNKKIEEILGFKPTISQIIGILCNNIEMFLERINEIGRLSEERNNDRVQSLNGFVFDSTDQKVYPFPKVTDKDYKEIYLGNIITINEDAFPELNFINGICDGLVYAIKQSEDLEKSLENIKSFIDVKYFPINANDLGVKPLISLDYLPTKDNGTINNEIPSEIIKRAFITYIFSKYRNQSFNKIADFEARTLFSNFTNDVYKDLFSQLSVDQNSTNSLLQIALNENIILVDPLDPNAYVYKDTGFVDYNKSFEIDSTGSCSSGNREWNVDINLKEEIKFDSQSDVNKFKSFKQNTTYIRRFYDDNLTYLNKSYLTLGTFIGNGIKKSILGDKNPDTYNLLETSTFNNFLTTATENNGKYFYVGRTISSPLKDVSLTSSSIYKASGSTINERARKGYLILSSFLFESEELLNDEIGDDYTKIIRLPYLYLLWLGANSFRLNNPSEILIFDQNFPAVPKDYFYYVTEKKSKKITNPYLLSHFQSEFESWISDPNFVVFENLLTDLLDNETLSKSDRDSYISKINQIILKEYDLLIYDSTWMTKGITGRTSNIPIESLTSYLTTFMTSYNVIYREKRGVNTTENKIEIPANEPVVNDKDIKYGCYIDIKQIYDNWIAGNPDKKTYNCCSTIKNTKNGSGVQKLYDLFKFVDKFRNETAGDSIININSFNDLVSRKDTGLYSFISKVLTDSYFMHFSLPFYIDFLKEDEVASIFEPQDTLKNLLNTPSLLCVYNGPPSSNLKSGSNYADDSFKFTDVEKPKALFEQKEKQKNTSLVAFNVSYGSQTQSIFKNISVSTQESKVTGEYMTLLSNYVLGTGESKPLVKDNSIYPIMRSRSYTATIQMMGDMVIQPQMYFQLENIPFFSGSYMIMNVSHQIKPNNIMTTFKGVRQNRSPVNIITEPISFLTFQFDKGIYSSTTVTIETQKNQITEAQSNNNKPVVSSDILLNYKPITGTAILKSYDSSVNPPHLGIDIQVNDSSTRIESVNKNGIVLANLVGTDEKSGYLVIRHEVETDGYFYYTAYFGIKDNNLEKGNPIVPKTKIGLPKPFKKVTTTDPQITPSQPNNTNPPTSQVVGSQEKTEDLNFYHFEIARSKDIILTYEEYLNSVNITKLDPQQFSSPTIKFSNYDGSLHNNGIYN